MWEQGRHPGVQAGIPLNDATIEQPVILTSSSSRDVNRDTQQILIPSLPRPAQRKYRKPSLSRLICSIFSVPVHRRTLCLLNLFTEMVVDSNGRFCCVLILRCAGRFPVAQRTRGPEDQRTTLLGVGRGAACQIKVILCVTRPFVHNAPQRREIRAPPQRSTSAAAGCCRLLN